MTLAELLHDVSARSIAGDINVPVTGLQHDSRLIRPGDVFFALPGSRTDGNRHAKDALERGAVAVVSDLEPPPPPAALSGTWIHVIDAAAAMGAMADVFFAHPSGAMKVIGVTGTNGKTTTTYFLESIVFASGASPGVVGTIEQRLGGKRLGKSVNTTPVALELTRLLARFRDGGATHALMEVSSHALALGRVDTIDFDAAVFMNLSRDHLDFHRTPEAYFEAKAKLFDLLSRPDNRKNPRIAALNGDDSRAVSMKRRAIGCEVVLFGVGEAAVDVRGRFLSETLDGSKFSFQWKGRRFDVDLRLPGRHNVSNALGAAAAMLGLGTSPDIIAAGLAALKAVPGRLEPIDAGQDFHVFVDFAHTASALETVLGMLRALPHGRILTVFGCGGDRDRTKRGPMGEAACRGSDHAFLTSDNPRGEDPAAIIADVEAGIRAAGLENYTIALDRGQAISAAIGRARTGDVVLIAGKGHEDGQILGDRTVPFDDREAARAALRSLR